MLDAEAMQSPPGETLIAAMERVLKMECDPATRHLLEAAILSQRGVWTLARRADAVAVATEYAGTPHRNRMALPREGVDCIHFVAAVLHGAGVIPWPRLPAYDERLGALRARNVIEDILLEHLHAERIEEPEFGAIVVCKCGRQTNHVGIVLDDGQMWHVPGRGTCGPEAVADWRDRVQAFIRITAVGLKADPGELTAQGILAFAPAPPPA